MIKIVINSMIGGFNLSYEAVLRYAELKGIKLYSTIYPLWLERYEDKYESCKKEDITKEYAAKRKYLLLPEPNLESLFYPACDIPRDDPCLVQVVEELGEKADPRKPGALKIVEIPDGVEWILCKADNGCEWIAEKHRTWS